MNNKWIVLSIIAVLLVGFILLPTPQDKTVASKSVVELDALQNDFIIRQATIYDGFQFIEDADILIEAGKVSQVGTKLDNGRELPEYNAKGKTLIPGLIDAHTHAWGDALKQALNFGVTTELDMFTMPEFAQTHSSLRDSMDNRLQADLFSATILATAPGGHGTEYGFEIPVLDDVSQVEEFVAQRVADGADYIKAVYDSPKNQHAHFPSISRDILDALVASAKSHNKMLLVHVDNLISAQEAIRAGADGLIHSFMDAPVDEAFVQLMLERKAFMVATLSVESSVAGINPGKALLDAATFKPYVSPQQRQTLSVGFPDFGIPASAFQIASDNVRRLQRAGVTVLAGSDAPNPGTGHGISLHDELRLLVQAGLSPEQALHAATGAVTKVFPIGQRGSLEAGAPASMLLLDGDPRKDITVTGNILGIWKNGGYYARTRYIESSAEDGALAAGLISDFSSDWQQTQIGLGISQTSDQIAGGQSNAELSKVVLEDIATDYVLKATGEVRKGFAYPWAGLAYIPGESFEQGANLSQLKQLVFDARGSAKSRRLSVLVFQQGSYTPATTQLKISEDWQTYRLDLKQFSGINLQWVNNISIVSGDGFGEFEFFIDNLRFE